MTEQEIQDIRKWSTAYKGYASLATVNKLLDEIERLKFENRTLSQLTVNNTKEFEELKNTYQALREETSEIYEEAKQYRKALKIIIGWGLLGNSYSDIAAASTFQRIAKEALEGNNNADI